MFEKMWTKLDEVFVAMDEGFTDLRRKVADVPPPKKRNHRIVSESGHITITGEYKSLTVNGKKVEK